MPKKRSVWVGGPPAEGSASVDGGVIFTVEDLKTFAQQAGLPTENATSEIAERLTDIVDTYILSVRIQRTNSERVTASDWGKELSIWAEKGRLLIGDNRTDVIYLIRTITHLSNALAHLEDREEFSLF